jgi:hypothetical protein
MQVLTIESAKAYVTGHHETNGETADIEGAAIFTSDDGIEIVRLNVTVMTDQGGAYVAAWDVWSEPLMGGALYGEC